MSNKVTYNLRLNLDENETAVDEVNTQVGEDIVLAVKISENGVLKTTYTGLTANFVARIKDRDGEYHKFEKTGITISATDGEFSFIPTATSGTSTVKLTSMAGLGVGEIYLKDSSGETTITNRFKITVAPTSADDLGNLLIDTDTTYSELEELLEDYNAGELGGMTAEQAAQLQTNTTNIASLTSQLAAIENIAGSGTDLDEFFTATTLEDVLLEIYSRIRNLPIQDLYGVTETIGATDIPEVTITGSTTGISHDDYVNLAITWHSSQNDWNGYCKLKWQGNSSLNYPKKNYTIKLYRDSEYNKKSKFTFTNDGKTWGMHDKFVLKANYIDHTHARNIVLARLWGDIVSSRSDYNNLPQGYKDSPNNCAIDGFPIKVTINGTYEGLYTWNIGKEDWMFGMDEDNPNHCVLCGELNNNGTNTLAYASEFRALLPDMSFSVEVPSELSDDMKNSFNNFISLVKDGTDASFKYSLEQYADKQSLIDYYLFMYLMGSVDSLAKNMIFMTYDGIKWYASVYDMDTVLGSYWNGAYTVSSTVQCPEGYCETNSLLWQRMEYVFGGDIKTRYTQLRQSILSVNNIVSKFTSFMNKIGSDLYAQDLVPYPNIPNSGTNNLQQITDYITARATYVDGQINDFTSASITYVPVTNVAFDKSSMALNINLAKTIAGYSEVGYGTFSNEYTTITTSAGVTTSATQNDRATDKVRLSNIDSYLYYVRILNNTNVFSYNSFCLTDTSGANVIKYSNGNISINYLLAKNGLTYNDLDIQLKIYDPNPSNNWFTIMKIDMSTGFTSFTGNSTGCSDNVYGDWYTDTIATLNKGDTFILLNDKNYANSIITIASDGTKQVVDTSQDNVYNYKCYTSTSNDPVNVGIKYSYKLFANGGTAKYRVIKQSDISNSTTTYGSDTITATITPNNASNKALTWAKNNANVSLAANGNIATITAVSAGTTTITATSTSEQGQTAKTASCTVTITEQ